MSRLTLFGRKVDRALMKHAAVGRTNHPVVQFARYALVVGVAAPIDLGGYVLLKSVFGLHYVLAATLSFTASLIVNYLLSVLWVFDANTGRRKELDAGVFMIIGVVGLGLTDLIIWVSTDHLGVNFIISKLIALAIVFFWSFGSRRWLFTTRTTKSLPPADIV